MAPVLYNSNIDTRGSHGKWCTTAMDLWIFCINSNRMSKFEGRVENGWEDGWGDVWETGSLWFLRFCYGLVHAFLFREEWIWTRSTLKIDSNQSPSGKSLKITVGSCHDVGQEPIS